MNVESKIQHSKEVKSRERVRVRISRKAGRGRGDNHDKSWSKSFQSKAASVRARVSGTRHKRQGKGERRKFS